MEILNFQQRQLSSDANRFPIGKSVSFSFFPVCRPKNVEFEAKTSTEERRYEYVSTFILGHFRPYLEFKLRYQDDFPADMYYMERVFCKISESPTRTILRFVRQVEEPRLAPSPPIYTAPLHRQQQHCHTHSPLPLPQTTVAW